MLTRPLARRAAMPAAGAIVLAVYALQIAPFWGQINDDAYITFRYSEFLAAGHGPVFNLGERVEGNTNPRLMLL